MKKQIFYELNAQYYSDRTNTGTGDFAGLSTKVDYFEQLGVNSIIFQNVLAINEIDKVQNYTSITKSLGNINEFKRVISLLRERRINTIIELGIGTIKENHKWFQYAINQSQEEFKSIVNFRTSDLDVDDKTQTLKYSPENKSYYLIDEDTEEVPLNWLSDQVIDRFVKIVQFWHGIGVGGFTFKGFEYLADETKQELMSESTLRQLRKFYKAIKEIDNDIIVVGRSDAIELTGSLALTEEETKVFDYFISDQFYKIGSSLKYGMDEIGKFKAKELGKKIKAYSGHPSQVIAFAHPKTGRVNSRWGLNTQYQYQSAKTIALALLCTPSSALIYYGDELGVFNIGLTHLDDFQDETLEARKRKYENLGLKNRAFMAAQVMQNPINSKSLMPWTDEKNGGFSYEDRTITPVNIDYKEVNVKAQYKDKSSPLSFYKKIIQLFSTDMSNSAVIEVKNSFKVHVSWSGIISYTFTHGSSHYYIYINLSSKFKKLKSVHAGEVLAQTYFHKSYKTIPTTLGAYESIVIRKKTNEDETKTIETTIKKEVNIYKDILIKDLEKKHDNIIQELTKEFELAKEEAAVKEKVYQEKRKERKEVEVKKEDFSNRDITEQEATMLLERSRETEIMEGRDTSKLEQTTTIEIMKIDKTKQKIKDDIEREKEKIEQIKKLARIEMAEKMRAAEDEIFSELGANGSTLKEYEIALTTVLNDDDLDFE